MMLFFFIQVKNEQACFWCRAGNFTWQFVSEAGNNIHCPCISLLGSIRYHWFNTFSCYKCQSTGKGLIVQFNYGWALKNQYSRDCVFFFKIFKVLTRSKLLFLYNARSCCPCVCQSLCPCLRSPPCPCLCPRQCPCPHLFLCLLYATAPMDSDERTWKFIIRCRG